MSRYYYALENFDLRFTEVEIDEFIELWNQGHSLKDIAKFLKKHNKNRTFNEVSLLLFELSANRKVKKRKNGIDECFEGE
jgi:hypothetical protein